MAFALQAENKQPNFLVFLVDDLGYMDVGANNPNCFYDTPHIDALAASGMRFTDGYAANPVCSPTRYSLMTGKYPTRVDATNFFSGRRAGKFKPAPLHDQMDLDEVTPAEALKKKKYATYLQENGTWAQTKILPTRSSAFDINTFASRWTPYTGKKYFSPFKTSTQPRQSRR